MEPSVRGNELRLRCKSFNLTPPQSNQQVGRLAACGVVLVVVICL
ncbi:hypothetical protein RB11960 [Rhodopirellula baltica SH 1]|uniref:Uncharacterized protein n=1 Tax=Rhodopirellula baltica (strain DSM 10527 / NCIMB 13988 / SH1) TaxID=243090 RepID=Q7UJD6_RHOBA|nr:hypothetical protein RB11960 [Rhodopirellula baltica SH 1]